jgi:hypothetical protein
MAPIVVYGAIFYRFFWIGKIGFSPHMAPIVVYGAIFYPLFFFWIGKTSLYIGKTLGNADTFSI